MTKTLKHRGYTYQWMYEERDGTDWYKRTQHTNDKYAPLYINKGHPSTVPPEMSSLWGHIP